MAPLSFSSLTTFPAYLEDTNKFVAVTFHLDTMHDIPRGGGNISSKFEARTSNASSLNTVRTELQMTGLVTLLARVMHAVLITENKTNLTKQK